MAQSTQYGERETSGLKERATEAFENAADKATDQFKDLTDQAQGAAGRIADRGREAGQRVQEVAGNFKGAVDKSMKQQPMATLVFAAIAGFVLGALWKR
jgi:ElaB/YqjD/DUF883 family membrane-anchored ribosome-binding protein